MSGWDLDLTPPAPRGIGEMVGESPYPFNDIDVHPQTPCGDDGHVGTSPFSAGTWDTEPLMHADRHDGHMDLNRGSGPIGKPKPGSF